MIEMHNFYRQCVPIPLHLPAIYFSTPFFHIICHMVLRTFYVEKTPTHLI